jgi:hypothetical protein
LAQSIEAAQKGVLEAILELNSTKVFTNVITNLYGSVLPAYVRASALRDRGTGKGQGVGKGQISTQPSLVFSAQPSGSWRFSQQELKEALQAWARRFRLTDNLRETGECLPWILDFGYALCQEIDPTANPARIGLPKLIDLQALRDGFTVPNPDPQNENRSEYRERVRPLLDGRYGAALDILRSKPFRDKRNTDHYKWFVLRVCANKFTYSRIVQQLGPMLPQAKADRLTVDAVRKGIAAVRRDLRLQPKKRK